MIHFFRRIRQGLLSQNRFSKYLLYAIGEILLVVLGILIALSINNWNEQRKKKSSELNLLKELLIVLNGNVTTSSYWGLDLQSELDFQLGQLNKNKESIESCEILIEHLENNLPYQDTLKFHFALAHSRFVAEVKAHAYEKTKSNGFDFIKNDSLKSLLYWTYETNTIWINELDNRNNLYENNVVYPKITKLFNQISTTDIDSDNEMIPLDFQSLKHDNEYLNILRTTLLRREEYILYQEKRYNRLLTISELLQKEISSYED
jgi:hypothetical protein